MGRIIEVDDMDDSFVTGTSAALINGFKLEKNKIQVIATYDGSNLTHLKFAETKFVNRELLKIISLIVEFFPYLVGISIKCGIDRYTSYELCKIVKKSNITEVYLDDTFVREGNYTLLLKEANNLQILSLARCKIGDNVASEIASTLHYPKPASLKLSVLDLSSNNITSVAVKSIAAALRANRKLCYLNLASNSINDDGVIDLLKICLPFKLTTQEYLDYRCKYTSDLKLRQEMVKKNLNELLSKKLVYSEKGKKSITSKKDDSQTNMYKQAVALTEVAIGKFEHPFVDSENIDGDPYCNGNFSLAYLNVAYNNLSCISLEWLEKVLLYQKSPKRGIKGSNIINVRLEGNPLPVNCNELNNINYRLEQALKNIEATTHKKKK